MSTPKWQPGTLYPTGSLVQPLTSVPAVSAAITNPGFESGSTDWTLGAGMTVDSSNPFSGSSALRCGGTAGPSEAVHDEVMVSPGQSITATCMYQQGGASTNQNVGRVFLRWYDASMVLISDSDGSLVIATEGNNYKQSTVTAIAPALSAFVSIGGKTNRTRSEPSRFDNFTWNYATASAPAGLIYKAVQPTLGTSAASEPSWPPTLGDTVVDNTVIWEALIATRVVWEASPILLSGAIEPTWPEAVDAFVSDNTISWKTVPRQVLQAPQSKVVTIASSKVYAADGDIVRYCATVNPLDWTTPDDAGYLPTGLNQYGSNKCAVLNTYRGNVVPFSASTFQNWQVDPDPANITLLDSMEGIGSTYQQAAHPVANDMFYLSPLGVRTVGIAAGTANLAAGDAGAPIDPLVSTAIVSVPGVRPLGAYYPNQGQYWLCMRPPLPVVIGPSISGNAPDGVAGIDYARFNYAVVAGDAPIVSVLVVEGSIPTGLTFDQDTGSIEEGIPTVGGVYSFTLEVTDQNGLTARHSDQIPIANTVALLGGSSVTSRPFVLFGPNWAGSYQYNGTTPQLGGTGLLGGGGRWVTWEGSGVLEPVVSTDSTATSWAVAAASFGVATKTQFGAYSGGAFLVPANDGVYRSADYFATVTKVTTIPAYALDASPTLAISISQFTTDVATAPAPFTTWTGQGVPHGITLSSGGIVRMGGGRALLGGGDGSGFPKLVFTAAGTSFTSATLPTLAAGYISTAAYDQVNKRWVAGTDAGQIIYMDEADGIWHLSAYSMPAGTSVKSIEFDGASFVAAGNNGVTPGGGIVVTSPIGEMWTAHPTAQAINSQILAVMK